MKKTKYANIFGIILYTASAFMLIYSVYLANSQDIWYDELFSMEFAVRPISDMIRLTAADVHPPLYYIIVHFAIAFGRIFSLAPVTAAKLASVIPYGILFLYGITVIRKRYGILPGGLFAFAVISMPNMAEYTVEIRMYGYVILFITAMCIHAKGFIVTDPDKQIRGLKWRSVLPLFIYGLCACYTQYYAAVAVFAIYLFLVIWSVRKNIWQLGILLISANLNVILFFPWIATVISQVGIVSENYWIQELTWRSLGGVMKYLTKASFTNEILATVLAVVLFLLLLAVVIRNIRDTYMWLCFAPIIGIVCFGFAASFLIRPFFVYRYMLPGMGAFWFGVITAIFREKEPEGGEHKYPEAGNNGINSLFSRAEIFLPAALVLLMSVIGIRDYYAFRGNELYRRVNMVKTSELFDELKNHDNLVIVSNFDQVDALLAFYLNEDALNGTDDDEGHDTSILLYGYEPEKLIAEMVKGVGSIEDGDAVEKLLKEGKEVYFLGSFNSREDILRDWNSEQGIENENHGSYLMERYWFDVFELSLME